MSDFFKQLLIQVRNIWVRFNTLQKTILVSIFMITFVGLVVSTTVLVGGAVEQVRSRLLADLLKVFKEVEIRLTFLQ